MEAAAGDADLKQAFADHLEVTKTHVARLEEILELLGEKILAKKCDAMEGLTMSGEHVVENTVTGTQTRDLGILMAGLKVENFEITTYKGLIQVAGSLGHKEVANLLQQTLNEEIESSNMLTEMSQAITGNQPSN
jgi:ferritin-like metal-binding protein YciE